MKISEMTRRECGSPYEVAISSRSNGDSGHFECEVCGATVARWSDASLRAFRLEMAALHGFASAAASPASASRL